MDREEEIGRRSIGTRHAAEEAFPGGAVGDEQDGLGKACVAQLLLDPPRQPQVEVIFEGTPRADGAGGIRRVPDIHNRPECGPIASRNGRFLASTAGGTRPARMPCAWAPDERSDP